MPYSKSNTLTSIACSTASLAGSKPKNIAMNIIHKSKHNQLSYKLTQLFQFHINGRHGLFQSHTPCKTVFSVKWYNQMFHVLLSLLKSTRLTVVNLGNSVTNSIIVPVSVPSCLNSSLVSNRSSFMSNSECVLKNGINLYKNPEMDPPDSLSAMGQIH